MEPTLPDQTGARHRRPRILLLQYNGKFNNMIFATVVVLSAMGLYAVIEWIERRTIPWHVSQCRDELSFGAQTTRRRPTRSSLDLGGDEMCAVPARSVAAAVVATALAKDVAGTAAVLALDE